MVDVNHQYVPFSDHLVIKLNLQKKKKNVGRILNINNTLLKDFNDQVKGLAKEIFSEN